MKILCGCIGMLSSALVFGLPVVTKIPAQDSAKSPLGCKDVGYDFDLNVLKILPDAVGERQSLYFVYNKLKQPLHLSQMLQSDSTIRTPLNHKINAEQWSVLATTEPELKYICTIEQASSKYGKVIPCRDSVKVCEYVRVKFGLNNRGNFWLAGSNNRGGAVGDVGRYGIIPK